jgi:hypothetical protein
LRVVLASMIAESIIIFTCVSGGILVAVDGAWAGSYVAANLDRPKGMPSYFASDEEKHMYAMRVREGTANPAAEFEQE